MACIVIYKSGGSFENRRIVIIQLPSFQTTGLTTKWVMVWLSSVSPYYLGISALFLLPDVVISGSGKIQRPASYGVQNFTLRMTIISFFNLDEIDKTGCLPEMNGMMPINGGRSLVHVEVGRYKYGKGGKAGVWMRHGCSSEQVCQLVVIDRRRGNSVKHPGYFLLFVDRKDELIFGGTTEDAAGCFRNNSIP